VEPPISAKWDRWLSQLTQEVLTLFFYRELWRRYIAAADGAKVPPSFMFTFFAESYATRQAVAIRRHTTFELSPRPLLRTGMREPERGPLRDEVEVGVGMEEQRVRVDRDGRDQAVDELPDGEFPIRSDELVT
jgi:hypothetical protein